jgi:methylase of polypeptide subunit release factors
VNNILETTSRIYFEIGDGQGEIIKSYINGKLKCEVYLLNDLFGRERMIKIEMGV